MLVSYFCQVDHFCFDMADLQTEVLEGCFLKNGRYRIDKRIAHGAFGAFHHGYDTIERKKVAIKFEKADAERPQLNLEFNFYKILNSARNVPASIPKLYYFDSVNNEWSALVIELLGPSLKAMYQRCEGFSIATSAQLLMQLTVIMEYVHDYLGCAKHYVNENNEHIPYIEGKPLAGTMRFASANNQQGREISRRDDLEALLYQAVYFVKKELPWDGHGQEITNVFQKQIAQGQFKEKLAPEELCIDMPRQFAEYLRLVRKCEFSQRPPYRKLLGLMRDVLTYLGIYADEDFYDWDESQIPLPLYRRS